MITDAEYNRRLKEVCSINNKSAHPLSSETRTFDVDDKADVIKFVQLCTDKSAYVCSVTKTPSWNVDGQKLLGVQFTIVYQHKTPIGMKVTY